MVQCHGITVTPASKTICLQVSIDNANENPVRVAFKVCEQSVSAHGTVPVGVRSFICGVYTVGPGLCLVSAIARGAAGGRCSADDGPVPV